MFGSLVHQRSDATSGPFVDPPEQRRAEYGRAILAELLTRAEVLRHHWTRIFDMQGVAPEPECVAAVSEFFQAARVFLTDCAEAAVRVRRARLVGYCGDGAGFSHEGYDIEEELAKLGGPYPWAADASD